MKANTPVFSGVVILLFLGSPVFAYREVIDLGTLGGSFNYWSTAYCINDNGQIVGISRDSSNTNHATLFDATGNGANIYLGTLGGNVSTAMSINNNGQIVGSADDSSGTPHACLFDSINGRPNISLASEYSFANSINDKGQIAGTEYLSPYRHAYLFDITGKKHNTDLGVYKNSEAYSINNKGTIAGWTNFRVIPEPLIPPQFACTFNPFDMFGGECGQSINDNGLVVGYGENFSGNTHAYLHNPNLFNGDKDLGAMAGFPYSKALCINDNDQIVGIVYNGTTTRACLFDSTGNGNNIDLNTLIDQSSGWALKYAYGINNSGWIVGQGTYNGNPRAFLLTPEPTTLLLFGSGITLLRRKK